MQIRTTKNWKKVKIGAEQRKAINAGKTTLRRVKKEVRFRQARAYFDVKLKSQGLLDSRQKKSTLTVRRISDLTEQERAEIGLPPKKLQP